jgi:hypothetical protein
VLLAQSPDHLSRAQDDNEAENQLLGEFGQFKELDQALPTPEATLELDQSSGGDGQDQDQYSMPRGWQPISLDQEAPDRSTNNAPRRGEINSQLDQGNIITEGRRSRRLPGAYAPSFMSLIRLRAADKPLDGGYRLHHDQLPPPLKR